MEVWLTESYMKTFMHE